MVNELFIYMEFVCYSLGKRSVLWDAEDLSETDRPRQEKPFSKVTLWLLLTIMRNGKAELALG